MTVGKVRRQQKSTRKQQAIARYYTHNGYNATMEHFDLKSNGSLYTALRATETPYSRELKRARELHHMDRKMDPILPSIDMATLKLARDLRRLAVESISIKGGAGELDLELTALHLTKHLLGGKE
jgi:hypothetical protein